MQEGILRRIGHSKYAESFCLKGGLLLYTLSGFKSRPTLDIDLLGLNIPSDAVSIQIILSKILSIPIEDGLSFDTQSMSLQEITEGADYHGQRVKVLCRLGSIRTNLKLDIGFGDIVFPGPVQMEYPLLLDSESFRISAYSLESVIAEKFEAMIILDIRNSRMKDFYDIYDILINNMIDIDSLKEAIRLTFERRQTILPLKPAIFQNRFSSDPRNLQLWKAFLNRIKINQIDFSLIMEKLQEYLYPVYKEIRG
ncbi:MAG: nucleotidyl transferase AbiEii/AbiGii toxin family protein [Oceanispirochaeta sp.]|nr:nucleotidyl transferase AbiEii/AbiGii toxin family protein [Oceanispirochaeta sp.]MDA3957721.1 nucleotidyl transferase AbiEii/AbiGii toxin family protein [Oceanispirochaeta sp.]